MGIANLLKKGAENGAAFLFHEPGVEPGLMVEAFVFEEVHQGAAATGFGVGRAVVDLVDAGEDDSAGAHGAGLERDVEARAFEPPASEVGGGLGDGQDLGMGRGVLEDFALVVGFADDLAVVDDNAADGDLPGLEGLLGFAQSGLHISRTFVKHGQGFWLARGALSNDSDNTRLLGPPIVRKVRRLRVANRRTTRPAGLWICINRRVSANNVRGGMTNCIRGRYVFGGAAGPLRDLCVREYSCVMIRYSR